MANNIQSYYKSWWNKGKPLTTGFVNPLTTDSSYLGKTKSNPWPSSYQIGANETPTPAGVQYGLKPPTTTTFGGGGGGSLTAKAYGQQPAPGLKEEGGGNDLFDLTDFKDPGSKSKQSSWSGLTGWGTNFLQNYAQRAYNDLYGAQAAAPGMIDRIASMMPQQIIEQVKRDAASMFNPVLEGYAGKGILNSSLTTGALRQMMDNINRGVEEQRANANLWGAQSKMDWLTKPAEAILGSLPSIAGATRVSNQQSSASSWDSLEKLKLALSAAGWI